MIKLHKNIILGVVITLSGSLAYVLMSAIAKIISKHLTINEILFLQNIAGLVSIYYFIRLKKYKWRQFFIKHNKIFFARILLSLASIYTLIYGLKFVSIFNALVILNSAPLIIPYLRKLLFKHKINLWIFPAMLLAFSGVVLILAPDQHIIELPNIIILISMLCMALSLILLEINRDTDPNLAIFYYFLYSSAITGLALLFQHNFITISPHHIILGILTGVLFFGVQMSVVYAARYISAQLIAVLFYAEIIFALGASFFLENLAINNYLLLGTILVIFGGLAVILVENKMLR